MATPTFDPNTTTLQDARTGAIPITISDDIITDVKNGSAFMRLAKGMPISTPETKFTYLSGIGAYWVDEAERIQTSKPTWTTAVLRTKKLGVIIPASKENLRYSVTNFFELMRPEVAEAFYKKFDAAAIANIDNPYAFSILSSATAVGGAHVSTETDNKYNDLNLAMGAIEAGDLDPNGVAATRSQRAKYRATKDDNGLPIFNAPTAGAPADVLGLPIAFMPNASFGGGDIAEIVGDWNQAYYGILQGIEYEILDQATLTTVEASDAPGKPLNLAERDMMALKATFELGIIVIKDEAFSVIKSVVTP